MKPVEEKVAHKVIQSQLNNIEGNGGHDHKGAQAGDGVTLKMLDLICPKEQPCDNVPATRPLSESTTQPLKQKEAEPTP